MLYNIEAPLNNSHLPTTATNLGSRGRFLNTNLTVQVSPFTLVLEAEALKIDLYVVNVEQNDAHLICGSLLSYKYTIFTRFFINDVTQLGGRDHVFLATLQRPQQ